MKTSLTTVIKSSQDGNTLCVMSFLYDIKVGQKFYMSIPTTPGFAEHHYCEVVDVEEDCISTYGHQITRIIKVQVNKL